MYNKLQGFTYLYFGSAAKEVKIHYLNCSNADLSPMQVTLATREHEIFCARCAYLLSTHLFIETNIISTFKNSFM